MKDLAFLFASVLVGFAGCSPNANRPAPSPTAQPRSTAVSSPAKVWMSQTTGKEYRVEIANDRLTAEWTNIPPLLSQHGAFIKSECRRVGTKWVGSSQVFLPCTEGSGAQEHIANWCHLTAQFEIDAVTADRIVGRSEGLLKFDCQHCKIIEKEWKDFVWAPAR